MGDRQARTPRIRQELLSFPQGRWVMPVRMIFMEACLIVLGELRYTRHSRDFRHDPSDRLRDQVVSAALADVCPTGNRLASCRRIRRSDLLLALV